MKPKLIFHVVTEPESVNGSIMAFAEFRTDRPGMYEGNILFGDGRELWGAVIGYVRDFRFTGEAAENVLPGEY